MTTFPQHVDDYLRLRRALGYKLVEPGRTLPRFAARLEAIGTEFVTVDAALVWALEPDVPPGSVVRPMLCNDSGVSAAAPLPPRIHDTFAVDTLTFTVHVHARDRHAVRA
jgi:hypothetical protein